MKRIVSDGERRIEYEWIPSGFREPELRILPDRKVWLYGRKNGSLREADRYILERSVWIRERQEEIERCLDFNDWQNGINGTGCAVIEGRAIPFRVERAPQTVLRVSEDACVLELPAQRGLEEAMLSELSRLALLRIREKTDEYARFLGVSAGRLCVRSMGFRWGSCDARGNLNFNWKLIEAPPEALRYVVLHETVHRKIFNHSESFWKTVETGMPEYKSWKDWLSRHGRELGKCAVKKEGPGDAIQR